jgi:hypothetical protein
LKSTAASGDVTLERNNTKVKIYTAETGGTEITFNGTDNVFSVGDLPKDLYVKGYQLSTLERDVTLTLTHGGGGGSDDVRFTVVQISLYRHCTYTQTLDDWPETSPGANDRSAKHIFGKLDPIYVEVRGLGTDPISQEIIYDAVQVTSECDTSGVPLTLKETGVNTAIFNNSLSDGELLYLSTATSQSSGDKIRVIDEEVLTFKLNKDPLCYRDVMVDRGEYSVCGIHAFFRDATTFKDEMEKSRVDWWQAGCVKYPNNVGGAGNLMRIFIKNAGSNSADHREADFLFYTCHGSSDGYLWDERGLFPGVEIMRPSDINNDSDWNNDVEWIWADACCTLNVPGGGYKAWDNALFGLPRPAHMILGYHKVVKGDCRGIIEDFFNHACGHVCGNPPDTIVSSFYHANTDGSEEEPCAIVEHLDNDGDKLKVVTRDTDSTSMKYYWYDTDAETWSILYYTAQ